MASRIEFRKYWRQPHQANGDTYRASLTLRMNAVVVLAHRNLIQIIVFFVAQVYLTSPTDGQSYFTRPRVDPAELEALITNHFLLGRPNPHLPADVIDPGIKCVRRRWSHTQNILDHVWKRWLREYLPSLTVRKKWTRSQPNLAVGNIVLNIGPKSPLPLAYLPYNTSNSWL